MKIRDIIQEDASGKVNTEVADTLPATYKLPGFPNQDAYMQYRFGVAIAGAKHNKAEGTDDFDPESSFGRDLTVVCYSDADEEAMDSALALMHRGGKVAISTHNSEEPKTVVKKSPIKAFKGYPR